MLHVACFFTSVDPRQCGCLYVCCYKKIRREGWEEKHASGRGREDRREYWWTDVARAHDIVE